MNSIPTLSAFICYAFVNCACAADNVAMADHSTQTSNRNTVADQQGVLKTITGKSYTQFQLTQQSKTSITIRHSQGIAVVPIAELDDESKRTLGIASDPELYEARVAALDKSNQIQVATLRASLSAAESTIATLRQQLARCETQVVERSMPITLNSHRVENASTGNVTKRVDPKMTVQDYDAALKGMTKEQVKVFMGGPPYYTDSHEPEWKDGKWCEVITWRYHAAAYNPDTERNEQTFVTFKSDVVFRVSLAPWGFD